MSDMYDIMSDFKKMTEFEKISDLEKLYKILDIHVNDLPKKDSFSFSPEVANSKHDPTEFNKEDEDHGLVKIDHQNKKKTKEGIYTYILEKYKDGQNDNSANASSSGDEDAPRWSKLTHLYIGSLTIIGLYAVFRALQRS